jgi:hypothetical protein
MRFEMIQTLRGKLSGRKVRPSVRWDAAPKIFEFAHGLERVIGRLDVNRIHWRS